MKRHIWVICKSVWYLWVLSLLFFTQTFGFLSQLTNWYSVSVTPTVEVLQAKGFSLLVLINGAFPSSMFYYRLIIIGILSAEAGWLTLPPSLPSFSPTLSSTRGYSWPYAQDLFLEALDTTRCLGWDWTVHTVLLDQLSNPSVILTGAWKYDLVSALFWD